MHWKTILFGILTGLVEVLCDEYRLLVKRRAARTPPKKEAPPPEPTMGWGSPTPPPPVTVIRVETDEGSRVAAASFVGSEYFGQKRAEKEHQPGESRRRRRQNGRVEETNAAPEPEVTVVEDTSKVATAGAAVPKAAVPARSSGQPASPARPPRRPVLALSTSTLATLARGAT